MFNKNKLLAILLTGIVSFSCMGMVSHAAEVSTYSSDSTETNISVESDSIPGWPSGPAVSAEAAIVLEANTGAVLYSKNADSKQYPASITKIMTTLLALENSSLDEVVTFSTNAVYSIERDSSHIARTDGEELTMEQCLYAVMLESANECANAVAEHIAGSVEAFAQMMNDRAAQIGCTGTNFVNPHGLHKEDHYITARDMALITQEALKNETFRTIAGTIRYKIPPTNKNDEELTMNHHHSMLSKHRTAKYYDETVFAGKNGYTTDSLNTLVTCANRGGMELIIVVLRCPSGSPYTDTAALLDYAEENFSTSTLPGTITDLPEQIQEEISNTITGFDPAQAFLTDTACTYAVLPNGITMDSLDASVSSIDKADGMITASVSYSYEGNVLGNSSWYMSVSQETPDSELPKENETAVIPEEENENSNVWKRILKIILIGIGVVTGLLFIIILLLFIRARRIRARRRRRNAKRRRRHASQSRSRRQRSRPNNYDDFDF